MAAYDAAERERSAMLCRRRGDREESAEVTRNRFKDGQFTTHKSAHQQRAIKHGISPCQDGGSSVCLRCYKTAILDRIAVIDGGALLLLLSTSAVLRVRGASRGGLTMSELLVHI